MSKVSDRNVYLMESCLKDMIIMIASLPRTGMTVPIRGLANTARNLIASIEDDRNEDED